MSTVGYLHSLSSTFILAFDVLDLGSDLPSDLPNKKFFELDTA
jgi:hypothetical protein